jgi:hypothetical protein
MQYPLKYQAKKVMTFGVLKVNSANFMMSQVSVVEEWAFAETILKHFSCFRLLSRKTRLSHSNFFYSNKFGFASNIWACLSANITLHNQRCYWYFWNIFIPSPILFFILKSDFDFPVF